MQENRPFPSMFAPGKSIHTPDSRRLVIHLGQPHPALLLALTPALAPVLPVFPVAGTTSVTLRAAPWYFQRLDVAHHPVLPAFALAVIYLAQHARLSRVCMLEVPGCDATRTARTARAKGAAERTVLFRHALRKAALPILTVARPQFGNPVLGALLVEAAFNRPRTGRVGFRFCAGIARRSWGWWWRTS